MACHARRPNRYEPQPTPRSLPSGPRPARVPADDDQGRELAGAERGTHERDEAPSGLTATHTQEVSMPISYVVTTAFVACWMLLALAPARGRDL